MARPYDTLGVVSVQDASSPAGSANQLLDLSSVPAASHLLYANRHEIPHLVRCSTTHHGRLISTEHGEGLR